MNRMLRVSMMVLCAAVLTTGVYAAEKKNDRNKDKKAAAGMKEVTIPVTGMMCGRCEASVTASMKKIDGVSNTVAEMGAGTAVVTYDPAKTDVEKILAGFKTNKAARFDAYKPGEKPAEKAYTYSGKEETLSGRMSVKGAEAGDKVVCRMMAHRAGEENERLFNLIASGEMAKKIEEVRKSGVPGKVTGVVSAEGITVTKIDANY